MSWAKTVGLGGLASGAVLALGLTWPGQPKWGELLNPFTGLWAVSDQTRLDDQDISMPQLKAPVTVLWDRNRIPHVAAENIDDLYRVLGYLHARLRLFQMDVQSRMGGARLSELVGAKALPLDRALVQIGMRESARRIKEKLEQSEISRAAIKAYIEGVNTWVENLTPEKWPSEYRLMGVSPSRWSELRVAELIQLMIFRLAGRSSELDLEAHRKNLGEDAVMSLFPTLPAAKFDIPSADLMKVLGLSRHNLDFRSEFQSKSEILQPIRGNGSNNWAVGPARSQSGVSLLANDTHLAFSLPNVWFETQLLTPEMNVYGGGFAGAPSLMSGFTAGMAWAVTNGTTDVLDWYEVQFDSERAEKFKGPKDWQSVERKVEEIKIKGQKSETHEILWTQLGPVIERRGLKGLVERWTSYEADDVMSHFLKLNHGENFSDCQRAIANFQVPVQNFICADSQNVGLFHRGAIPRREWEQGRFVEDASAETSDWRGFYQDDEQPHLVNPSDGVLFSANQKPVGNENKAYLGWDYENSYRAARIRELLSEQRTFTADDFRRMQLDDFDPLARSVLPSMLRAAVAQTKDQEELLLALKNWDYHTRVSSVEATLFFVWWREFSKAVWSDQLGSPGGLLWPNDQRLQLLLENLTEDPHHGDGVWVDDTTTEKKETLDEVLNQSLQRSFEFLQKNMGPKIANWTWQNFRPVEFRHVGRVPGLGRSVSAGGSKHALNAIQAQHGPTWRMVVELSQPPRAWTSTPGTAEGETFSGQNGAQLKAWAQGDYKEVQFFQSIEAMRKEPDGVFWRFHPKESK